MAVESDGEVIPQNVSGEGASALHKEEEAEDETDERSPTGTRSERRPGVFVEKKQQLSRATEAEESSFHGLVREGRRRLDEGAIRGLAYGIFVLAPMMCGLAWCASSWHTTTSGGGEVGAVAKPPSSHSDKSLVVLEQVEPKASSVCSQ